MPVRQATRCYALSQIKNTSIYCLLFRPIGAVLLFKIHFTYVIYMTSTMLSDRSVQAMSDYFRSILSLAEVLLRSAQPVITQFACALYRCTFVTFDTYSRQVRVSVAKLLLLLFKRNWFTWCLTIKTLTGALYKVYRPTRYVQNRAMLLHARSLDIVHRMSALAAFPRHLAHIMIIVILMPMFMARPLQEFTRFMQNECQAATNTQTKPSHLDCESTC